jgi:signal peptidase I
MVYRRIRRLMEWIILCFTGLLFLHTWFVDGFPVFRMVQGGSMATTLLGSHVDLTCPECKFSFSCDADDRDAEPLVVCPNCGAKFSPPTAQVLAGDRVLIDRTAFQVREPARWEVVAFDRSDDDEGLVVKRVVGLPGETIEIKDGDVYVNDQIRRKNLRQQRALRILVHDDDSCGDAPRWRAQGAGSNWTRQHGHPVHAENLGEDIGWLVYNHASPASDNPQTPARITDYGFYNRGRMQQRNEAIHPMADVAMSFRIEEIHGRGLLWLQATDGRDQFMVQIDPGKCTFIVQKNPDENFAAPVVATGDLPGSLRGQTIEVSLFDRQFLLAIAGKTLVTSAIDTPGAPPLSDQPLAIGAKGLGIVVDRLRVYRDVYYTGPPVSSSPDWALGPDEYFVLGDNSPISEDSRTWTADRFVQRKSLVGKPFVVIFPAQEISLGKWSIQVPDLTRIRYIR